MSEISFSVVIPAAGIGKRVGTEIPKQYLNILNKTIIEHSITPFLAHPEIKKVVVSIAENDQWFSQLTIAQHPKLVVVEGGKERVDSVFNALSILPVDEYVLVHDAARPCIQLSDINKLIAYVKKAKCGAMLAYRVRDTMKRSDQSNHILQTVERHNLWHALTPQLFKNQQLLDAIVKIEDQHLITDEASAIEMVGGDVTIIEGRSDNLKVTQAEDLLLAEFYLSKFNIPVKETI
ncbi:2-C-methyl-D-erythritol 4-phosphate cytidylyltransferase [Psychromonas sp. RZ22]|uniref:2-C-methyl-D-erythritol 4-phosphate cytidylyltransferase n=1 Tax=Psychromonas algarum TaxID=2555643 RepID=UPI0010683839|nr:2-C-methyl-D-erythritol 4-phosphate cytidylyltransferase [Psychromonas sp. RZ22]TEW53466.1 2-C-methyl-D-erythritol 4-phosphate cytidylyltransferase [Psychromonas sp. RZ22]